MTTAQTLTIRSMQVQDLTRALELTQAERWPHTARDWQLHFELGQGWVACTADGTVVGTTVLWPYGESAEVATVGLIIVDRDFQGRGIGRQLLQKAIASSPAKALRLVATAAGLKLYRQNGFEKSGMIQQRQGVPVPPQDVEIPPGMNLRPIQNADLDQLVRLDAAAFGACRRRLLTSLLNIGHGVALTDDNGIAAFAILRPGGRGMQFGPVVAADDDQVKCLLTELLQRCDGFTRIDVTDRACALNAWLDAVGLPVVDEVTAMSREGIRHQTEAQSTAAPALHTYGLVSQALG